MDELPARGQTESIQTGLLPACLVMSGRMPDPNRVKAQRYPHLVVHDIRCSNGDRTKEIVTIHYSNNQEDRLILDKDLIDTARMYEEIDKISSKKTTSK